MVANPIGFVLGGLLISRLVSPSRRQSLVRPFAVLAPASLVPALLGPSALGVAAMAAVCGFAVAGMMPTANGLFVQALPHGYRARAFGVMQSGVQVMQGVAVLGTGLLADVYSLPAVVGVWSVAGVALMLLIGARWPSPQRFADAIAAAGRTAQAADPVSDPDPAPRPAPTASPRHELRDPPTDPPGPPPPPTRPPQPPGPVGPGAPLAPDGEPVAPAPPVPWVEQVEPAEPSRAGRHNAGGGHRAGAPRATGGPGIRDDGVAGGTPRNAGPRVDDLPVRPTSPPTGASAASA
jgi:hypothetical protein